MSDFSVAYVPVGVPTFHLESAQKEFDKSVNMLRGLSDDVVCPEEMLLSLDALKNYLESIKPDLIILQNITFANSAYVSEVLKRFDCPIILWTLREPVIDGGRLRLNSLTGAYSAGNAMRAYRESGFEYCYGSAEEKSVIDELDACIRAARVKNQLSEMKLCSIGHTPEGFGFGRALDVELLKTFGVELTSIEARELIDAAKGYDKNELEPYYKEASGRICGLDSTNPQNLEDFTRLYKAYKDFVIKNSIAAISSRCWPDFFTSYGTPVCAVLGMLNDMGVAASCEADTFGALSMYIAMQLTGNSAFFGDPVSMNEEESTITYWHCGTAACSLARGGKAEAGVHCNRKIGPTLEFGCKAAEEATVFRIGRKPDGGFRLFICDGEVLDKPKQFSGTSIVFKTESDAEKVVKQSVKDGWEPHFVVSYGKCSKELNMLANMLGIEAVNY